MHNKKLSRAGVESQICERLKHHHVETCEAQELWIQKDDLCFSTSLHELDRLLHGGLPRATITEVTGPSGCGKSQLCMMLSVLATLPHSLGGLDSGVIYIDTESAFSAERLLDIAQSRFPDYFSVQERLLLTAERVHVFKELTCQEVLTRLDHLEEDIISCHAGLVILDSVASVVRKEFDTSLSGNLTHRSNLLGQQAATLKYLAQEFRIPVVVTNQITTHVSTRAPSSSLPRHGSISEVPGVNNDVNSGYVTAALGNTWSHNVNTRLIVQYVDTHLRQIVIAKSPVAPFAVLNYTVQKEGIRLEVVRDSEPAEDGQATCSIHHRRLRATVAPQATLVAFLIGQRVGGQGTVGGRSISGSARPEPNSWASSWLGRAKGSLLSLFFAVRP